MACNPLVSIERQSSWLVTTGGHCPSGTAQVLIQTILVATLQKETPSKKITSLV